MSDNYIILYWFLQRINQVNCNGMLDLDDWGNDGVEIPYYQQFAQFPLHLYAFFI
jgi:hypothetical protein